MLQLALVPASMLVQPVVTTTAASVLQMDSLRSVWRLADAQELQLVVPHLDAPLSERAQRSPMWELVLLIRSRCLAVLIHFRYR